MVFPRVLLDASRKQNPSLTHGKVVICREIGDSKVNLCFNHVVYSARQGWKL